jgi:hypothetical protein
MTRRGALMVGLLLAIQPAMARADGGSLDWLIGKWAGTGTSFGKPSEARFEAAPALDGKFVELRYAITKPILFEGRAFYRQTPKGWDARWFDSRGMVFPISAAVSGKMLTSDWGSPDTERGRTEYRLLDDGRLEVRDTVLGKDGQYGEFARQTFTRTP